MSVGNMYLTEVRAQSNVKGRSNCSQSDDAMPKQYIDNILDNDREQSISPNSNSPTPPSLRRYERSVNGERNFGLFRQLSQRFGLRSYDDPVDISANDDDNHSSSTDSCSSSQTATTITTNTNSCELQEENRKHKKTKFTSHLPSDMINSLDDLNDCDISNDGKYHNDGKQTEKPQEIYYNNKECRFNSRRLQRRSASTIRKAFESFSLSTRSLSCSGSSLPPKSDQTVDEFNTFKNSNNTSPNSRSPTKYVSNLELYKKHSQKQQQQQQQHICETKNRKIGSLAHDPNHSSICSVTLENVNKANKSKQPPQRILRQPVSYTYLKGISGLPTQRVPRNSVCCQYVRR